MRNIKTLLFAALAMTSAASFAQDDLNDSNSSYWFFGVKGGLQETATNYDITKLLSPAAGIEIGYKFAPQFGMRLDLQGMWAKTAFKSADVTYDFNYINPNVDLLFNITNMLMEKKHFVDVSAVLGIGYNFSWNENGVNDYPYADRMLMSHKALNSWNTRAGLLFDFNLTKNWGIQVEGDVNWVDDDFNLKGNTEFDKYFTAMVGVAYKWGHQRVRGTRLEEPVVAYCNTCGKVLDACQYNGNHPTCKTCGKVVDDCMYKGSHPICQTCGKEVENCQYHGTHPLPPVVYSAPEEININIFFDLDKSEIRPSEDAKLRGLANWVKEHEVDGVILKAYADKETGNSAYNMKLSERRAEVVAKILTEQYGIPASRIESSSYGDTVQPFSENELNRVAIITVKEVEKK